VAGIVGAVAVVEVEEIAGAAENIAEAAEVAESTAEAVAASIVVEVTARGSIVVGIVVVDIVALVDLVAEDIAAAGSIELAQEQLAMGEKNSDSRDPKPNSVDWAKDWAGGRTPNYLAVVQNPGCN
jgi:hypothetical protein